jgi:trans-2,3-dihydro-3-hydroxyanthranilate isomerase
VFARERFGGNPLAVIPDGSGLTDRQMQQIAREFNFSETTFVLPAEQGHTRRVRIFTPAQEVPFAGHPNLGTAFVLARSGELGAVDGDTTVHFEEAAGVVPVALRPQPGRTSEPDWYVELTAPQALQLGPEVDVERAAAALSLRGDDIECVNHPPMVAGVGLEFLVVGLGSLDALQRAECDLRVLDDLDAQGIAPDILLYAAADGEVDIRARMFAPRKGVPEDPATGSANCALAALLAHCDPRESGEFTWHICQGVEMGRPSHLHARVSKRDGRVTATRIGGHCVMVAEGAIRAG